MRLPLVVAAALLSTGLAAHADTVLTYQGNNYTDVYKPFTTSEKAVGTVTIPSTLAPDMNGSVQMEPLSYSFNDGPDTFTSGAPLNQGFIYLYTDAGGNLIDFYLSLDLFVPLSGSNSNYVHTLDVAYGPTLPAQLGTFASEENAGYGFSFTQGSLAVATTTAVTPEPSSVALLGTGMLGIAGLIRRFA